jgi:RNA polymerase sigma-70 factor (ECF subfamily)
LELNITEIELNQISQNNKDDGIAFFNTYYKTIYHFAYKMTGNKEDAEDILQEVFCIALQNIQNFRGESKISTWCHLPPSWGQNLLLKPDF